jgi:hypothetical protein
LNLLSYWRLYKVALEFNGSNNPNKELEALDVLLKGKSDEYKGRVLQYVRDAKVEANDPTFLLMAALGNLDVALIDLPKGIEAIDKTEGRIQQQLDTFEERVRETLAALKYYRDESYKILKVSKESYQKIVDDSHIQNQMLLAKFERLGRQLEEERNLRMSQPWKNAVNLPPLALVATIVLPLMVGMLIGSNVNSRATASVDLLRTQIYNTFQQPSEEIVRKILMEQENKKNRKKSKG